MLLWYRTARRHPPAQLVAWLRNCIRQDDHRPAIVPRYAHRGDRWSAISAAMSALDDGVLPLRPVEPILDRKFEFLNVPRALPDIDWIGDHVSPLWTYHLHYLDTAVDLALAWRQTGEERYLHACVDLWCSWLDAAERGAARIDPYPTSIRCMNALRCLWLTGEQTPDEVARRLLGSVAAQLDWLAGNVERHLRANHLQRNLTALAWGELVFQQERPARYLPELWDQLFVQVLPDGGHYERSPLYQAVALDDYLRTVGLCRGAGVAVPAEVLGRLSAMTKAFIKLSRPDGTLHLFNDAANGERPSREAILRVARRVLSIETEEVEGAFDLPDVGYFGWIHPESGVRLVVDAGPPGPREQPGHAHCDMLSFEFDLDGHPVIVDAGVHGYDGDPFREYVRSTRAHNTVQIDGGEQHEMWATFRVARRGEILKVRRRRDTEIRFDFDGACRPYHSRDAMHARSIRLEGARLTVTDRVTGGRSARSWLHFHPAFRLESSESGYLAISPSVRLLVTPFGAGASTVRVGERAPIQGWHCPEFGVAREASVIELCVATAETEEFGWVLERA